MTRWKGSKTEPICKPAKEKRKENISGLITPKHKRGLMIHWSREFTYKSVAFVSRAPRNSQHGHRHDGFKYPTPLAPKRGVWRHAMVTQTRTQREGAWDTECHRDTGSVLLPVRATGPHRKDAVQTTPGWWWFISGCECLCAVMMLYPGGTVSHRNPQSGHAAEPETPYEAPNLTAHPRASKRSKARELEHVQGSTPAWSRGKEKKGVHE